MDGGALEAPKMDKSVMPVAVAMAAFKLSDALPAVPSKLVKQIIRGSTLIQLKCSVTAWNWSVDGH